jgi:hypothetical protein
MKPIDVQVVEQEKKNGLRGKRPSVHPTHPGPDLMEPGDDQRDDRSQSAVLHHGIPEQVHPEPFAKKALARFIRVPPFQGDQEHRGHDCERRR